MALPTLPLAVEEPALLETRDLSLHYGDKAAFTGVSARICTGAITALIGPSGSGKTSFLNCLNRLTDLIPGSRLSGSIRLGSTDVLDRRTDVMMLRRRVGMIFQKPNPFPLSIRRNIEFPLREHGVRDRHELAAKLERCLTDVGLWAEVKDRLDAQAGTLSGGQQQRLCIARALALGPEVLLMDEPCSALDPISSGVVEDLILSLRGQYTTLIVTHNLAQARRIADTAALFWIKSNAGELVEWGPTKRIFEAPCHHLTSAYVNGKKG